MGLYFYLKTLIQNNIIEHIVYHYVFYDSKPFIKIL